MGYKTMFQALWNYIIEMKMKGPEKTHKQILEEELSKIYPKVQLTYTKRWVIDPNHTKLPMDVRDFVRPSKTLESKVLPITLAEIWTKRITYIYDHLAYKESGMLDVWQLPEETSVLKKGDCDDSGSFRHATANSNDLGIKIFSCLGYYNTTGHYFTVMVDKTTLLRGDFEDSISVIENTSNSFKPIPYKGSKYKIYFMFNENQAWKIKGGVNFGLEIKKLLNEFDMRCQIK